MKKILVVIAVWGFASFGSTHEGHDHDAPAKVKAPKGGVIKSLEEVHVELVSKGKDIKVYLYDKEMKAKNLTGFKVSAQAEMPRTKKTEAVSLTAKDNFYEGTFDAKGVHRYTLIVAVTDPKVGHEDKLKFTVEPRK